MYDKGTPDIFRLPQHTFVLSYEQGQVILPAGTFYVGRDRACFIRLVDSAISRQHLLLEVGDALYVTDLGSRNGTLLNGRYLRGRIALRHADELTLGSHTFKVQTVDIAEDEVDEITESYVLGGPEPHAFASRTPTAPAYVAVKASPIPQETASAPRETASAPRETTSAPRGTTSAPRGTTSAPRGTTSAPRGTASAPRGTARETASAPRENGPQAKIPAVSSDLPAPQLQLDDPQPKRRALRTRVQLTAAYEGLRLDTEGLVTNINRFGLFLVSDKLDAAGNPCHLRVNLDRQGWTVHVRGTVRHVIHRGRRGMAIEFDRENDEIAKWLEG